MLPRVLETEVMDTAEEAAEYNAMDHSTVNRVFVEDWLRAWTAFFMPTGLTQVLDVGTGTALIPIEFCRQTDLVHVVGVDLADAMLLFAKQNVEAAGLEGRIALERMDAKSLPFRDGEFDSVVSNSILHHIPEPLVSLQEMLRVLRPGGMLFIRDLYRPDSEEIVDVLVRQYAGSETPRQQELFRQSFHAALTLPEIEDMLEQSGLTRTSVTMTSDRHWTIAAVKASS
jgi:ubiquinone/menaquinone biosynthesis C-methylase UbiE